MVKVILSAAFVLFFAMSGASSALAAPQSDFDGKAYADRAIELARENALTADKVDWASVTAEMHRRAAGAEDAFDLYPALVYLLDQLKDDHSFLQLNSEMRAAYEAAKGKPFEARSERQRAGDDRYSSRKGISSANLAIGQGQARWIVVPSFSGGEEAIKAFANRLYRAVAEPPARCGYILDFRGNGGGNIWPMLAGLTPLLENGEMGYFVNAEGKETVLHRNGAIAIRSAEDEKVLVHVPEWREGPKLVDSPVAVLIDRGSGSSGEIAPIMLVARPNTRVFGTPTYGASTSTEGFKMPDGANLVIATAGVTDGTGKLYPSGLTPHETVEQDGVRDTPLEAAREWLAAQSDCQRRGKASDD